jgi:hypothetical protein
MTIKVLKYSTSSMRRYLLNTIMPTSNTLNISITGPLIEGENPSDSPFSEREKLQKELEILP